MRGGYPLALPNLSTSRQDFSLAHRRNAKKLYFRFAGSGESEQFDIEQFSDPLVGGGIGHHRWRHQ